MSAALIADNRRYSLSLVNDHAQLAGLAGWLETMATTSGLSAQALFRLDLVLTETVTNIMDYAHRPDEPGRIDLHCTVRDGHIILEVIDDGPAFDPTARAPVILPRTLEEATPGGLGIHLMRQYTDSMEYRRANERNVLRMTLPLEARVAPG